MPLEERPEPVAGPGQVVVAVRASGICGSDVHGFTGSTGRRRIGVVMGHEAAGEVIAAGNGVERLRVGDRVVLRSILPCGRCDRCLQGQPNLCAERVLVPEAMADPIPDSLSFEDAALVEPLAVAMHAVELAPFGPADTVAIVGAGPIGLLTLLAVRRRGAGRILVTDRDPHRLGLARALGADKAIDVAAGDPVERVLAATDGRGADAVLEAVGIAPTVAQSIAIARPGGTVTWVGNSAPEVPVAMQQVVTRELTIRGAYGFVDEFARAIDALAAGWSDAHGLIERKAPLEDGEGLFRDLAAGTVPAVKVVLEPNGP
jgi:L-iditol 2-dehydrogenase